LAAAARADGMRLIPAAGNAGGAIQKILYGLAQGTYYWSVQAVDWGFRWSAFAAEGSFSLPKRGELPPAPSVSEIPNLFTDEDVPAAAVSFAVGPAESLADLQVSVESDNPTLVPAAAVLISGSGSERALQITPATNQNGSAVLTVRVTDLAGRIASRSFVLSVLAINDPPVLADIPNQIVYMGNRSLLVLLDYSDVETLPVTSGLVVMAQSSNPDLIPQSSLEDEEDPRGFPDFPTISNAFEIRLPTNKTGSATITVTVSDRSAEVSKSFVLTILPPAFASTNAWTNSAAINVPGADFNNDGRLDLILTTPSKNVPELYRNTGTGFVATGVTFPAVQSDGRMVTADFNRDNRLDCLIINSSAVHLLTNNGGTNFSALLGHGLPRLEFPDITPDDLDHDGDTDLVLNGSLNGSGVFRVCYNENGVFRQTTGPLAGFRGACRVVDVDLDGWSDLVLVGSISGTRPTNGLFRLVNGGNYVSERLPENIGNASAFGLQDVNSDGRPELWIEIAGNVELYEYGASGFELVGKLDGWVGGWGDFDSDGDFDLMVRFIKNRSRFGGAPEFGFRKYRNEGDFTFTERGDPLFDAYPGKVHVADFNNDNAVDLIAAVRNSTTFQPQGTRLYLNKSTAHNSPPAAPGGLVATVSNGVVRLSWSAASDLNQRSGLTYNVRIGTHPSGSDILAPLSLANGRRLVPASGNAEGRLHLLITNLTREVYYWSVQAVDASATGGAFAPEQKFIVETPGNEPPSIVSPASVTSGEDINGSFVFTIDDDRTPLADLRVRVFPADPVLLPLKNISLQGTGAVRTVSFLPATNAFGSTSLSIVATDAVGGMTTNFVALSITNVNDAPRIAPITNQFSNSWREDIHVQVNISDSDNTLDQFEFEVSSDNPVLVPPANVTFNQTNNVWFATIRAASEVPGTAGLTFTVFDPARASGSVGFQFLSPIASSGWRTSNLPACAAARWHGVTWITMEISIWR
ncbi:MAG: FG-GAP-like repeat-containing protein, partial [Limisphaerales bacterium]